MVSQLNFHNRNIIATDIQLNKRLYVISPIPTGKDAITINWLVSFLLKSHLLIMLICYLCLILEEDRS